MSDQSSGAEEDHEDDEGLEPAVLYDLVAGLPRSPPDLTETGRRVDVTAPKPGRAYCGRETETETEKQTERVGKFPFTNPNTVGCTTSTASS